MGLLVFIPIMIGAMALFQFFYQGANDDKIYWGEFFGGLAFMYIPLSIAAFPVTFLHTLTLLLIPTDWSPIRKRIFFILGAILIPGILLIPRLSPSLDLGVITGVAFGALCFGLFVKFPKSFPNATQDL